MTEVSKRGLSVHRRLLVAFSLLIALWIIAWLSGLMLIVNAPLERADAIVVLSGSETMAERTRLAAQLFHEGRSSKVLLTNDNLRGGWSSAQQKNPYFYEIALGELRGLGVPETAIEVLMPPVGGTHEEALVLRDYAGRRQLKSFLIVTSAYHSRRALWTFRRVFAGSDTQVGLILVDPGSQTPHPAFWWLHGRGWKMVAGEYLKLAYYRLNT